MGLENPPIKRRETIQERAPDMYSRTVKKQPVPTDRQAWEQWQGEPKKWFALFMTYYLSQLPGTRRVAQAYRDWREQNKPTAFEKPTRAWNHYSRVFQWRTRADLYDEYQAKMRLIIEEEVKQEFRQQRIEIYKKNMKVMGKVAKEFFDSVEQNEIPAVSYADFVRVMEIFFRLLRVEFDEENPTKLQFLDEQGKPTSGVMVVKERIGDDETWAEWAREQYSTLNRKRELT